MFVRCVLTASCTAQLACASERFSSSFGCKQGMLVRRDPNILNYVLTGLVRLLLENGADASAKDKQGATPLHYAAIKGREEIALLLLSHGAEVSAKDNAGSTPLQFATNQEMAQLLLEHGAVPVKDTEGETRCRAAA